MGIQTLRHFLSLKNYDAVGLTSLLDLAEAFKHNKFRSSCLLEKNMGLFFSKPSTRTRVSFQTGIHQMGGISQHLSIDTLQMAKGESLRDTVKVLSQYLDGLIVRYYDINDARLSDSLQEIAENVQIPVVNALDEKEHPCQVLADILTLRQKYGEDYKKKKIVLSWGYSSHQKSPGVVNSFLLAASILGMNVTFARPKGFELADEFTAYSEKYSPISGANIQFCDDLSEACIDADAIYVKSYKAQYLSSDEDLRLRNALREQWTISEDHFKRANDNAFFMNCMPFIRGEQVTAAVADHPRSIIFDQAANRLHVQKAILENLFS